MTRGGGDAPRPSARTILSDWGIWAGAAGAILLIVAWVSGSLELLVVAITLDVLTLIAQMLGKFRMSRRRGGSEEDSRPPTR